MPDRTLQTDRRRGRIRHLAREAVSVARRKGLSGWDAYEAAKRHVRAEHGPHVPGYDAIINRITDRLEI